ncbi:MAG: 2-oxo acid dehydrogenase subunit E2 [Chloroflexi bacterium]|nr:2-oxo acid dehydrogenase subunit E2 [Chloroflexota bacterium]
MVTEVILPKLGQTMTEGAIVEWLKTEGEPVDRGDVLFTIESDKATLEVEAPKKGYLRRVLVPAGMSVPVLSIVGLITKDPDEDVSGYQQGAAAPPEESAAGTASPDDAAPAAGVALAEGAQATAGPSGRLFASPRARKSAVEHNIDLTEVAGSGPGGRIVERDVLAYVESLPTATPVATRLAESLGIDLRDITGTGPGGRIVKEDVQAAGPVPTQQRIAALEPVAEVTPVADEAEIPITGVRSIISRRMFESHQTTAPVTITMEVDATELVSLRERLKVRLAEELGFNLGYNDLLIKVVARALREHPNVNARLEGDPTTGVIRQLASVNVALAVDTDRGLLVPVVHDADRKRLVDVARELREVIGRAREGKATLDDLSGGTLTITNLGMYDVDAFTPIINLPEMAILGVGRIKAKAVVVDGQIVIRNMMWLSLTFDHRFVDGAPAARFLQRLKELVEEPYLLLV